MVVFMSETVQKYLLDYIRKKDLQPGDKLPSEREIMQLLEVGRSSVREALQILSERGIIEKQPGKGAYLKNTFHSDEGNLKSLLPSIDITHSLDLLEFRKGIETEVAYLAAQRMNEEFLTVLEESIVNLEGCVKEGSSIIVPDLLFHNTLAQSTKNDVIIHVYQSLTETFKKIRIEMAINDDVENALHYHNEIIKAIKQRNSEKSSILMRKHMEDVQFNYRKMLAETGLIEQD